MVMHAWCQRHGMLFDTRLPISWGCIVHLGRIQFKTRQSFPMQHCSVWKRMGVPGFNTLFPTDIKQGLITWAGTRAPDLQRMSEFWSITSRRIYCACTQKPFKSRLWALGLSGRFGGSLQVLIMCVQGVEGAHCTLYSFLLVSNGARCECCHSPALVPTKVSTDCNGFLRCCVVFACTVPWRESDNPIGKQTMQVITGMDRH